MPYAAVNDLRMHYEEHGLADGPPMVLLHGFTSTGQQAWRGQKDPFGSRYRLFVPDWRGHGRTNNPDGLAAMNHRQFAADIVAFCRGLRIDKPILCGTSSGAMMLLSLAVAEPELPRALVLSACTYYFPEHVRKRWREHTPEAFFSPERNQQLRAMHTAMGEDHWLKVLAAFLAHESHSDIDDFPAKTELQTINVPVLILHGDRDWYFPVEIPTELYRLLPDAELSVLPNTGHGVPFERPDWVASIVLDFLDRRLVSSV